MQREGKLVSNLKFECMWR